MDLEALAPEPTPARGRDQAFLLGLEPDLSSYSKKPNADVLQASGGNLGNLAFHFALSIQIDNLRPPVSWWERPATISQQGQIGVMAGANQVGEHWDAARLADSFNELTCRLVMVGLGAQSDVNQRVPAVPRRTVDWIGAIAARAEVGVKNLGVRGSFTQEVLKSYGFGESTEIVGCPSLFINHDPKLGESIQTRVANMERVGVAAGHTGWPHLQTIEQSLVRLVTRSGGSYIAQSDRSLIDLCGGAESQVTAETVERCRLYLAPEMSTVEFVAWSRRHGRVFTSVETWIEHYASLDFVVGTRYHGVALAIQSGIPGLVIAHDSRTVELCETTGIPYVLAAALHPGLSLDDIKSFFRFDANRFDENRRRRAQTYVSFMESNGVSVNPWLRELAVLP